jgi:hypothetical protein
MFKRQFLLLGEEKAGQGQAVREEEGEDQEAHQEEEGEGDHHQEEVTMQSGFP